MNKRRLIFFATIIAFAALFLWGCHQNDETVCTVSQTETAEEIQIVEESQTAEKNVSIPEMTNNQWKIFSTKHTPDGLDVKIVNQNLLLRDGVIVEADSEESDTTPITMLYDNIVDNSKNRWSSDNDWEDNEHWVNIYFPTKTVVGSIRLYWERLNASKYSIEVSEDGLTWESVSVYEQSPLDKCQDIIFDQTIETNYLRLHVTDVNKFEEDGSLYYQNISLYEMEVYGPFEDEFIIRHPKITTQTKRTLLTPSVPQLYSLEFIGCDYENLIDDTGLIADTLSDTNVDIGYKLCRDTKSYDLPAITITIPANTSSDSTNVLPQNYMPMEWIGFEGNYSTDKDINIYITDKILYTSAEILCEDLINQFEITASIVEINEGEIVSPINEGDILLKFTDESLPDEGYLIYLGTFHDNMTVIEANSLAGIRFGCVSYEELLVYDTTVPKGTIKDYPRYKVRGFGIDVGRKPISLDMLYSMVRAMSKAKMNTLHIHLNDNQIISQSEQDGSIESVLQLYSGFRLESDIHNTNGDTLTSMDLFYTKEEFSDFIETAGYYGIQIVPEIDTPAHSLSIIKVFPELGIQEDIFTADQLNLSDPNTLNLVESLWDEYLLASDSRDIVFKDCNTIHIGLDEYYGNNTDFGNYLLNLTQHLKTVAPDKNIRMWGSLSNMDFDYSKIDKDIQIQIWNTTWADPYEMYSAGFGIINSLNTSLYIIPGTGYDWLDAELLINKWEPNIFAQDDKTWLVPTYSQQMLGAVYMLWNDMIQIDEITITDEDIYNRFEQPLNIIADKLWN